MNYEPLNAPYDMYSVTDTGHVFNVDKERYVPELVDPTHGKM